MVKVLISDKMDKLAEDVFRKNGIDADVKTGLSAEALSGIIGEYDGLAIRSSTQVTKELLAATPRLKVVGRAGVGVDNIDIPAATERGVVVMNTPFGNSMTTAEHTLAMMFSVARNIPQASVSTHAGKWAKSPFMGVELYRKTLGVVGCGNIGSIVARRALALEMNVIVYDPYITDERAREIGVKKVDFDELLSESDFITLHAPKTDQTKGMIGTAEFAKMKTGVRLINCARGTIVNECELVEALDSGKVAGAAFDVFSVEPATENVLFGHEKVVCTPHLGSATREAQVNVALQVAEQISDYLLRGSVSHAINMPSVSAEDAPRLKPFMTLAGQIGTFAGQIAESAMEKIDIAFGGSVAELNTKPLASYLLASLLKPLLDNVNMVNAPQVAKTRGIAVSESHSESAGDFPNTIRVTVKSKDKIRSITGTVFEGQIPRIVDIEGVPVEAALCPEMIFIRNDDKPGLIGGVGTILGDAGLNISHFHLGRKDGEPPRAVALIGLDASVPDEIFKKLEKLPQVRQIRRLAFQAL